MGLRKVSTKATGEDLGMVYLLEVHIEEQVLVKIGITQRSKITDRVTEILVGIFNKYRYFPYIYPKRFKSTDRVFEKEATLHNHFNDRRYKTEHVFGGSTEFFNIPLDEAVCAYEKVLKGEELCGSTEAILEQ